MPIKITQSLEADEKELAWLCDEVWDLISQIKTFEEWANTNKNKLEKGTYAADIGFSPREGAAGSGARISLSLMKAMTDLGMEIYLSEYPPFTDREQSIEKP